MVRAWRPGAVRGGTSEARRSRMGPVLQPGRPISRHGQPGQHGAHLAGDLGRPDRTRDPASRSPDPRGRLTTPHTDSRRGGPRTLPTATCVRPGVPGEGVLGDLRRRRGSAAPVRRGRSSAGGRRRRCPCCGSVARRRLRWSRRRPSGARRRGRVRPRRCARRLPRSCQRPTSRRIRSSRPSRRTTRRALPRLTATTGGRPVMLYVEAIEWL